jgi:sortase (surface protein transpeptidase)
VATFKKESGRNQTKQKRKINKKKKKKKKEMIGWIAIPFFSLDCFKLLLLAGKRERERESGVWVGVVGK